MAAATFLPDAAPAPGGPRWLQDQRLAAAEALATQELPTTDLEGWRYSRIDDFDASRFAVVADPLAGSGVPSDVDDLIASLGALSGLVVLHNGTVVRSELSDSAAAAGVTIGLDQGRAQDVLGAAAEFTDAFLAANTALSVDPVGITVPAGVTIAEPIAVISYVDADGGAVFTRTALHAGADSDLAFIEARLSSDAEALLVPVTEIVAEPAARIRHGVLQHHGVALWQIGWLATRVAQDATLRSGVAALGGSYSRLRTDCHLDGRGATGDLCCVYFGESDQMLDFRTFQEHRARDTTSNLLFKGAVADESHSVYTGLIRIQPEAAGTNAYQTNRNLKLSENAWAESVPNLEINNNDVHCSHASTVSPVDEDQRFYLESRGVPTHVADRLIVGGFFDEVIDALPVPQLATPVRERLDVLLDRQVAAEPAA